MVDQPNHCVCSQEERQRTGWGPRPVQGSSFFEPLYVIVHFGCDRPILGHGEPILLDALNVIYWSSASISHYAEHRQAIQERIRERQASAP